MRYLAFLIFLAIAVAAIGWKNIFMLLITLLIGATLMWIIVINYSN